MKSKYYRKVAKGTLLTFVVEIAADYSPGILALGPSSRVSISSVANHGLYSFASSEVRLSRLPGWEKHSWGYHADDGWSFPGHKDGNPYGPTFDSKFFVFEG